MEMFYYLCVVRFAFRTIHIHPQLIRWQFTLQDPHDDPEIHLCVPGCPFSIPCDYYFPQVPLLPYFPLSWQVTGDRENRVPHLIYYLF